MIKDSFDFTPFDPSTHSAKLRAGQAQYKFAQGRQDRQAPFDRLRAGRTGIDN